VFSAWSRSGVAEGTAVVDAQALARQGEYALAADAFREVLGTDPGNVASARGLARALSRQGKYEAAIVGLKANPKYADSADLLAVAGRIHLRRGELEAAERCFRSALEKNPRHVESLHRLGQALAARGKTAEAKASWDKIVDVYQGMSYAEAEKLPAANFVEMGLALCSLNRFSEANDVMFSQAEERDAKNPELFLAYGIVFKAKYNYPDSREALREALGENPRFADALVALADNYLTDFQVGTKRYGLADEHLRRALRINPEHSDARTLLGMLLLSDGNVVDARKELETAVRLNPVSQRSRGLLATCLFLQGDAEGMARLEEQTVEINPRCAEFFHTIATAIETKFRYRDVVRYCDRAIEVDPDYWPAYVTLGVNCLRTGEEERGREFLGKSWDHDKFNTWVFNTRVLLRHMDKNHRKLKTDSFEFKFPKKDHDVLAAYLAPLLEKAYDRLTKRYEVDIPKPVFVEVFSTHKWFSARTVGLGGFAASGACFGRLVTLTTPKALPQNWGAVAWHEFAHVITLALSEHRVPRWLTEGLSVLEEGHEHPRWSRPFDREIANAYGSGRLLLLAELDHGFSKPKYPNQILISYYQGCLIAQYITEKWGFSSILAILEGYRQHKSTAAIFEETLGLSLEDFDSGFLAHVGAWVQKNGYEPLVGAENVLALQLRADSRPDDADVLTDLAWVYWCAENQVDAVITASKVLEIDPTHGDAHAVLGLTAYRYENNDEKARQRLLAALAAGTRFDFRAHATLGALAEKKQEFQLALDHYEKAKEISPRAGAAQGRNNLYYALYRLHQKENREADAIRQLEELSAFAVEDGNCRRLLSEYYLKQDDDLAARKGLRYLEELVYIQPFDRKLHQYLGRLGVRLEEHEVTVRAYSFLLKFPDTNPKIAYRALAGAHAALGNEAKAADFARRLLELDPADAEAKKILEQLRK